MFPPLFPFPVLPHRLCLPVHILAAGNGELTSWVRQDLMKWLVQTRSDAKQKDVETAKDTPSGESPPEARERRMVNLLLSSSPCLLTASSRSKWRVLPGCRGPSQSSY